MGFDDHIADVFSAFGPIQLRRMFSGYGLFRDGLMFGLVIDDVLFLKADARNVGDFLELGLAPFTYARKGRMVHLSYYQAPDAVMDDSAKAAEWAQSAFEAALREASSKAKKAKRTATSMKQTTKAAKSANATATPSRLIDARLKELADWRGQTLARVRALIREADPDVVEDVKWRKPSNAMRGVPVWEHAGLICTGETYKAVVKLTFAKGASLKDPAGLFNSSLEGSTRRAIDIREGDKINEKALVALIRAAVALNTASIKRSGQSLTSRKKPKSA